MPWKARKPVDLRMEMMVRLSNGEKLTDLCREYGISRKTGEKFKKSGSESWDRLGWRINVEHRKSSRIRRRPSSLRCFWLSAGFTRPGDRGRSKRCWSDV